MAAKLQEELSVREENKLQRTMDAATVGGPSESCTKVGLVCAQPYQALAEACRRVLLAMALAQSNNDATNTLPSLKNAREVARNTIGSFHI
jgi:DNA mismatch repair protein MSH3